jgi:hypothetical protein
MSSVIGQQWIVGTQARQARLEEIEAQVQTLQARVAELERPRSVIVPITTLAPEPFELTKPIQAVVEAHDGDYIASFYDANVNASGCNEQEAIENLKDLLVSRFEYLDRCADRKMAPVLARQRAVLREFIRRRN